MGGSGSGAWQIGAATTEDALKLDLDELQRRGWISTRGTKSGTLEWSQRGVCFASVGFVFVWRRDEENATLVLSYEHNGEPVTCRLELSRAKRSWGAWYWRAQCPLSRRLVRRLYCYPAGKSKLLASREALGLVYPSTRDTPVDAAIRRMHRVQAALERAGVVVTNGDVGTRPKGMHARRYTRLSDAYHDANLAFLLGTLYHATYGRDPEPEEEPPPLNELIADGKRLRAAQDNSRREASRSSHGTQ